MLEAFVITLREGVEAALVVCLLLAYLQKTGRTALRRPVVAGFLAAVAASIAVAVLLRFLDLDPENEAVEGTLLLVSALFVGSMVAWMWFHGKKLKGEIEAKVDSIAAAPGAGQKAALFLFTFLMVGREGVETVLFLAASSLSSAGIMTLIGGLAGLAVAVLLGLSFLKGSLRVDLRKFFAVTTVMLLIFAAQLLVGSFHEFIEAGVLKVDDPARYMAVVGPLVRHSTLFILAIILLPFALVAWHALRAPAAAAPDGANPAEERKQRAMTASERSWRLGFSALAALAVLVLGVNYAYASRGLELSPTILLAPHNGLVHVPVESLKEGELGRYGVVSGDVVIRFLVHRARDRTRTAFDACRLCGDKGYVQDGDHVLCLNCTAEIQPLSIGADGGCNPIPLPSTSEGGRIRVAVKDLETQRDAFKARPELRCAHCGMAFKVETPGQTTCPMDECRRKAGSP